jgi:hypothetical protein
MVHQGQGQAAQAFGIRPVTPDAIERVMAPDVLHPVRRRLALMRRGRLEFLCPDCVAIHGPRGAKGPATPQGTIRVARLDLGKRPSAGIDVLSPVRHRSVDERLDTQLHAG